MPIEQLPVEPFDLGIVHVAVTARVGGVAEASAVLLAAARGAAVVVSLDLEEAAAESFLDDLARLADLTNEPGRCALDDEEERLLRELAGGATLSAAAARLGLSRRTAHRRLAEVRRRMSASSTAEAIRRHAWNGDSSSVSAATAAAQASSV